MREGEEPKTPRYASAAASRNDRLPYSRYNRSLDYIPIIKAFLVLPYYFLIVIY